MRFEVRGTPVPQGSIRSLGKGRPSIHGNAGRLLPWREHVQHEAERALAGAGPMEGPVEVILDFWLPKPASAPKRKPVWPVKRPDLDHLVRAVADACTAAGVWRDDSQIVALSATKTYAVGRAPGVQITVTHTIREELQ